MIWHVVRGRHLKLPVQVPCYHWRGHVIWGLTLALLDRVVRLV